MPAVRRGRKPLGSGAAFGIRGGRGSCGRGHPVAARTPSRRESGTMGSRAVSGLERLSNADMHIFRSTERGPPTVNIQFRRRLLVRQTLGAAQDFVAIVENKSERIEIRTTPSIKALLQRAAVSTHKTVAEFLLEAGISAAEDTLADRRVFRLDDKQWRAFQDILDRPVADKPR